MTLVSNHTAAGNTRAARFVEQLDERMRSSLAELEQSEAYRVVADRHTPPRLLAALVKHILLASYSYGPHMAEASFTAIGRLPKHRPDLMKPMLLHNWEEVDHSEMALRDYVKLGGDEERARSGRISPAAFAVAATVRMIAEREDPFAYLGYMYFMESLTPILAAWGQEFLAVNGFPTEARTFVDLHATEDVAHARGLRNLIVRVVDAYPDTASAIEYALDCFAHVYPLPVWAEALRQARAEAG